MTIGRNDDGNIIMLADIAQIIGRITETVTADPVCVKLDQHSLGRRIQNDFFKFLFQRFDVSAIPAENHIRMSENGKKPRFDPAVFLLEQLGRILFFATQFRNLLTDVLRFETMLP